MSQILLILAFQPHTPLLKLQHLLYLPPKGLLNLPWFRPTRRHTCCIWIEVAFLIFACKCITQPVTVQMAPSPGPASQEASMTNLLPIVAVSMAE